MIKFILNHSEISTELPGGMLLLDFIRYQQHLAGTKIGCREGDCGACTVLVGELKDGVVRYASATSCLMAIGNARGKHIVTIEGLNLEGLNAVQQAFADEGATQCGFCTPGFIVSLAGYCINPKAPTYDNAIDSMNGNICRCTGYKSIERAAASINSLLEKRNGTNAITFAIDNNIIPQYFSTIKERLDKIAFPEVKQIENGRHKKLLGGGTDLYVQQHETMLSENIDFLFDEQSLNVITQSGEECLFGAAVTAADIASSPVFINHFPELEKHMKLVSSTPIRNMATIAGNFCNASPIGDFSIFFLALDAQLLLNNGSTARTVPLRQFFKGYKELNKTAEEYIQKISFRLPHANSFFSFEKVSKRTWLDIASVNTAIHLQVEEGIIVNAGIAAGGVGPVPLFLVAASSFLKGKKLKELNIDKLLDIIQSEISPISDTRGSASYKRLLLQQLVKAHFFKLTNVVDTGLSV